MIRTDKVLFPARHVLAPLLEGDDVCLGLPKTQLAMGSLWSLSRGENLLARLKSALEASKELEKFGSPQMLHTHIQDEFARAS